MGERERGAGGRERGVQVGEREGCRWERKRERKGVWEREGVAGGGERERGVRVGERERGGAGGREREREGCGRERGCK